MPKTITCEWQMSDGKVRLCPNHNAGEKCVGICSHHVPCRTAVYSEGLRMWLGNFLYAHFVANGTIEEDLNGED